MTNVRLSEMRRFASLEYEFDQSRHLLRSSLGECVAISLLWIQDKTINTNRPGIVDNRLFRFRLLGTSRAHQEIVSRASNMRAGAIPDVATIRRMEDDLGIRRVMNGSLAGTAADMNMNPIMVMEQLSGVLPFGNAALVRVDSRLGQSPNHVVALYKSRSGTLHFFDANLGSFSVRSDSYQQFFRRWKFVHIADDPGEDIVTGLLDFSGGQGYAYRQYARS
ncbi:MAG: hypothetical protein INR65_07870 [Gluconacetobacter diazotrophicus]|nr:hypothetical protein [Gluconacetobacter diazotrophicus]